LIAAVSALKFPALKVGPTEGTGRMEESTRDAAFDALMAAITTATSIDELRRLGGLVGANYSGPKLTRALHAIGVRETELIQSARTKHSIDAQDLTPIDSPAIVDGTDPSVHRRKPRGYDVLLRSIPAAASAAELAEIRALAAAQYGGRMLEEIEDAIVKRLAQLSESLD
jgi:hypothetical protein